MGVVPHRVVPTPVAVVGVLLAMPGVNDDRATGLQAGPRKAVRMPCAITERPAVQVSCVSPLIGDDDTFAVNSMSRVGWRVVTNSAQRYSALVAAFNPVPGRVTEAESWSRR